MLSWIRQDDIILLSHGTPMKIADLYSRGKSKPSSRQDTTSIKERKMIKGIAVAYPVIHHPSKKRDLVVLVV